LSSTIAGLILAGGLSRRMGGEKALQLLAGEAMISRVIGRIAPQVEQLAINANSDPAPYRPYGLPVLPDTIGGHLGPLAGVLTGLEWAARMPDVTHLVSAATDTPFLPRDLVARLGALSGPERIVMARSNGNRHPAFGLWPVALREDLARWLVTSDTMKVQTWAARHELVFCDFEPEQDGVPDPFFNANTPEELAQAEAFVAGSATGRRFVD
jgi:molybdopterin-guanine dinucleotide biosynthesis protein A